MNTLERTSESVSETESDRSPVRVLLVADSYWPVVGGGETHSRMLAERLVDMGAKVTVLTQYRFSESPHYELLDDIPIHRVGHAGFKRFGKYLMVPAMYRWIKQHRHEFDVLYVCGLRILGAPVVHLAGKLNKPVVLRIESCEEMSGNYIHEHLVGWKALARPLAQLAIGWRNRVMLRADAFLAISSVVADEYRACGVPDSKIAKIFNGVDLSVYASGLSNTEKLHMKSQLGLPTDKVLLTYTGKLNKGKGLEYLLEAMRPLRQAHPDIHLVLVGAGAHMFLSLEEYLRSKVAEYGLTDAVTFTGYQTNVVDYLQVSDIFVMPSEMEALCISLIEALAAGLPSVASSVGGIPDVARHEQEALLVPPRDADELASAIERLLTDKLLAQQLRENGRARANEIFGIDVVTEQHLQLFTSLTARQSKGAH